MPLSPGFDWDALRRAGFGTPAPKPGFDWDALKGIDWKQIDGLDPWERLLKTRFPALSWVLDHDELSAVIKKGVDQNWTEDTFLANIQATKWWTSRTDSQQQWDIFAGDDTNAAEVANRIGDQVRALGIEASKAGLNVSAADLTRIATSSLRNGLDPLEIRGLLFGASTEFDPGAYTASVDTVQAIGRSYMVDVSEAEANKFATNMFQGEIDVTNVEEAMKALAYQRHPSLRGLIDQGVSPQEFFRPHQERLGQMLGRSSTDINLFKEFSNVISFGDGKEVRPMSLAETERYARTLDEYWDLEGGEGEQEMYGMINQISKSMGVRR